MWIECVLDRPEPVIVPIGNEVYHFDEDAHGRKVAEVWIESHIECFLAVSHLYRPVAKAVEPEPKPTQNGAKPTPPDNITAVRAEYYGLMGKRPFNGWDVATLRAKMAAKG
jgi:hypothetical protein